MHTGYIKLWRKFSKTSFFKNPNAAHLAIYLLLECEHETKKETWNGQELIIKKGQCKKTLPQMSIETGLSMQSLRTSLNLLRATGYLTDKLTNKFRIISIGKYDNYQSKLTDKLTDKKSPPTPININPPPLIQEDKNTTIAPEREIANKTPVNWENCKTDVQRLATYFIKNYIPELYKSATQSQATAFFKRQGRALSSICTQCGTVEIAIRTINLADKYYNSKNPPLDWNLNTVDRNLPEFLNSAIYEEKKQNEKTK